MRSGPALANIRQVVVTVVLISVIGAVSFHSQRRAEAVIERVYTLPFL